GRRPRAARRDPAPPARRRRLGRGGAAPLAQRGGQPADLAGRQPAPLLRGGARLGRRRGAARGRRPSLALARPRAPLHLHVRRRGGRHPRAAERCRRPRRHRRRRAHVQLDRAGVALRPRDRRRVSPACAPAAGGDPPPLPRRGRRLRGRRAGHGGAARRVPRGARKRYAGVRRHRLGGGDARADRRGAVPARRPAARGRSPPGAPPHRFMSQRKPARSPYLVGPRYDWAFFLMPPLAALVVGILISGTSFAEAVFELGGGEVTMAGLVIGTIIHAHLVAVFFRSHGNRDIFRLYPWRFVAVPLIVWALVVSSTWMA